MEQFLVEEAILVRIDQDEAEARERQAEQRRLEDARAEAQEKARAGLEAFKATRARAEAGLG